MRSRTITHQVGRQCELQTSRANSHPKFSQTRHSCREGAHDRTQYRPTTDSALMKWFVRHAAWLISRFKSNDAQSPFYHAMGGPYCGHVLESCECVLAHLPGVGKGSGNPAPKLADKWTSAWLARATSQTSIWSEQMRELCSREAYDESPSTAGQRKTFEQLSQHTETKVDDVGHLPCS